MNPNNETHKPFLFDDVLASELVSIRFRREVLRARPGENGDEQRDLLRNDDRLGPIQAVACNKPLKDFLQKGFEEPGSYKSARIGPSDIGVLLNVTFTTKDDTDTCVDKLKGKALDMHISGLALSGGGIRSASFGIGILQGLARLGILNQFD